MPVELKLRMWLPAMPVKTRWILQSAISSASSSARWMAFTVASMFTTTPFFRPRDSWRAHADHVEAAVEREVGDERDDLGGADVERDDQIALVAASAGAVRRPRHRRLRPERRVGVEEMLDRIGADGAYERELFFHGYLATQVRLRGGAASGAASGKRIEKPLG